MKRMLIATIVCGCVGPALMAAEPAGQPESVEFKFNFEPDRVIRQRVVTKSFGTISMASPMPEQKFSQVFEQTLTSRCRKVNADKSAVLDVSLDDLVMKMSIGPMSMEYDSRTFDPEKTTDPMTRLLGKIFSAMAGAKFTVTMSETGQPLKVEGLGDTLRKAAKATNDPQGGEWAEVSKLFDQLGSLFDDETMGQQMQSMYRMSPQKKGPIKVGDRWEQDWSMKMPIVSGELTGKGEYELLGVQELRGRPCAKVRVKETFVLVPKPKEANKAATGMQAVLDRMEMELSSSGGEGVAYIDYQRGELVQLRQTQSFTIKITVKSDPNAQDAMGKVGMELTQKLRNSVTMDLLEGDAPAPAAQTRPASDAVNP